MSDNNRIFEAATALSKAFMPAEQAQGIAALQAAKSLALALEVRAMPGFREAAGTDAAISALARGVTHSIEADAALREAHRKFAKLVPQTALEDLGWGCTGPDCPGLSLTDAEPVRLRPVAA